MENRPGLRDVIAGETNICYLDEQNQKIYYRGIDIKNLIEWKLTFEQVAHLLLFGEIPTQKNQARLWETLPEIFRPISKTLRAQTRQAHPMDVLSTLVRVDGNYNLAKHLLVMVNQRQMDAYYAKSLTGDVGYLTGVMKRWYEGKRPLRMQKVFNSASKNILYQMFGKMPDEFEERLMNISLILYSEHEFNAGTFAVRVAASAHTDIFSAIITGISTLRGSRHGGANEDAMNLMLDIGDSDKVKEYLDRFFETKGARLPGFGHAVYTISDPRVDIIRPYVKELSERKGDTRFYEIAIALEEYMAARAAEKGRGIPANIDLWIAPLYYLMGIPIFMFTPLFAAARVAGWCSHYLEVMYVTRDPLMRPRAKYIGPEPRA